MSIHSVLIRSGAVSLVFLDRTCSCFSPMISFNVFL